MAVQWINNGPPALSAENLGQGGGSDGLILKHDGSKYYLEQGGEDVTTNVAAALNSYVEERADALIDDVLVTPF